MGSEMCIRDSANTGQSSIFFDFVHWLPFGDKIGHAGLFGLLTVLTNVALGNRRVGNFPLGTLLVIGFVFLEEVSQHFLPNRTFDIIDLLADGVGIMIGSAMADLYGRRKQLP